MVKTEKIALEVDGEDGIVVRNEIKTFGEFLREREWLTLVSAQTHKNSLEHPYCLICKIAQDC